MLDKAKIKKRFAKASSTYEQQALIQKQVCVELAQSMQQFIPQKHWNKVLEIGCGTGSFTREVLKLNQVDVLYLNDLYAESAEFNYAMSLENTHVQPWMGDIEQLEIPQNLDLVMSSSVFQWMTDLPALLEKINSSLKPKGFLVFSSFGPENLREIKQLTGCGLDYLEIHILQRYLLEQDFEIVMMKNEVQQMHFDHPRDVLQHLKETGVTATGQHRWTKSSLQQFYLDYAQFMVHPSSDQPAYPLTYHPIQCIVRKK